MFTWPWPLCQREAHESRMPRQLSACRLRMRVASCADGTCSPTSTRLGLGLGLGLGLRLGLAHLQREHPVRPRQRERQCEVDEAHEARARLLHVARAVVAVPRDARLGAEQRVPILAQARAG